MSCGYVHTLDELDDITLIFVTSCARNIVACMQTTRQLTKLAMALTEDQKVLRNHANLCSQNEE